MYSSFFEFEKKVDSEKIKYKEIEVWPIVRDAFYYIDYSILAPEYLSSKEKKQRKNRVEDIVKYFYGFKNWFGRYETLFFSDSLARKPFRGEFVDCLCDGLIDQIGPESCLLLERPRPYHTREKVKTKYYASTSVIAILIKLYKVFTKKVSYNSRELKKLAQLYSVNLDEEASLNNFIAEVKAYSFLLKLMKPNRIFFNRRAGSFSLIYAAKKHNIRIIEIAHGITNNHPAYKYNCKIGNEYKPDSILVLNDFLKTDLELNGLYKRGEVFSLGSYMMELEREELFKKNIFNFKKKYKKIVCFTVQWTCENDMIELITRAATLNSSIVYIIIPRRAEINYKISKLENIVIATEQLRSGYSTHKLIKECDIHITSFSTCAIESLALGVPTIMINYRNNSDLFFSYINDGIQASIVENEFDLVDTILNNQFLYGEKLQKYQLGIKMNYKSNVINFLNEGSMS